VVRVRAQRAPDWWLTAGAVFQTVWNGLDRHAPGAGIADHDFFYYDASDLSYEAEDIVIRRAATLFGDLGVTVEVRNEARVHLWHESRFGVPGPAVAAGMAEPRRGSVAGPRVKAG
jgi:hypothetical protein